jgi:hypothetical protein
VEEATAEMGKGAAAVLETKVVAVGFVCVKGSMMEKQGRGG